MKQTLFLGLVLMMAGVVPGGDVPFCFGATPRGLIAIFLLLDLVMGGVNWVIDLTKEDGVARLADKPADPQDRSGWQTIRLLQRMLPGKSPKNEPRQLR